MKFLKYVLGIIIAISVIPIIIVSIDKVTEPVNKTINFNILYDEDNEVHYLDPNVYDDLVLLMEISDKPSLPYQVINLVSIKVDDVDILSNEEDFIITYKDSTGVIKLMLHDDDEYYDTIKNDNTVIVGYDDTLLINYTNNLNECVSMSITFRVPIEIPPLVLIMLGLIPAVFISGILYVMFKKQKD